MTLAAALDDQLKDVGSFASIALALLVIFTNRRADSLDGWQEDARRTTRALARLDVAVDVALCLATVAVLGATAALMREAICQLHVGHASGTLRQLYVVVWFGFIVLAALQAYVALRRGSRYRAIHGPTTRSGR